jgi:hypothetical protein
LWRGAKYDSTPAPFVIFQSQQQWRGSAGGARDGVKEAL